LNRSGKKETQVSKLWLVARHEYKRRVLERRFILAVLSLPLMVAALLGFFWLVGTLGDEATGNQRAAVGYVDHAGLLADPVPAPEGDGAPFDQAHGALLLPFQTEQDARAALDAGTIQAYYVLAEDYAQSRHVELVSAGEPDPDALRPFWDFLRLNLLADQAPEIARRAVEGHDVVVYTPDGDRESSSALTLDELFPLLTSLAFFILLFSSSGYLMGAVVEEKANRTMEIVATSISPQQLIAGKALGIVALGLTQLAAWLVIAALAIGTLDHYMGLAWLPDASLSPQTVLAMLAIALPAYVMLAALMTATGAIIVDAREGQQVTALGAILLIAPLAFPAIAPDPDAPLVVGMTLFPFTALPTIGARAIFTPIPSWQLAASATILVLCALGALGLAGRALRLGMLRYGQVPNWRDFFGRAKPSPDERKFDGEKFALKSLTASRITLNKTLFVIRHEIVTTVTRRAFLFTTLGFPLIVVLTSLAFSAANARASDVSAEQLDLPDAPALEAAGYVDPGGVIQSLPANLPPDKLSAYPDEEAARQALDAGEITAYYVIPEDYVETGELAYVHPDPDPLSPDAQAGWMRWTLLVNLLGGDAELADRVWTPAELETTQAPTPAPETASPASKEPEAGRDAESAGAPYALSLLFYFVILMVSGLLLNSIGQEKKNRVMEIVMLSISPHQLISGKVIGLGIVGLIQTTVWLGAGYALWFITGKALPLPSGFKLPLSTLAWSLALFLLGYAVYASLMAGVGALAPDPQEASRAGFVLVTPLLLTLFLGGFLAGAPHGALATGLSLFPLTAPAVMVMRLAAGSVPLWQVWLALGLLALTAFLAARAVARTFRAQHLLSGQPFSLRRFFDALMGLLLT
jgi:ABC-2 type transport system permease protein